LRISPISEKEVSRATLSEMGFRPARETIGDVAAHQP
jgi:hypothetical protein